MMIYCCPDYDITVLYSSECFETMRLEKKTLVLFKI